MWSISRVSLGCYGQIYPIFFLAHLIGKKQVSSVQTESKTLKATMSTEYIGKMLDGQMHGHGKLIYENEEYYEGDFVRGKQGGSTRLHE